MIKKSNKLIILFCIIFPIYSNLFAQSIDSLNTKLEVENSSYKLYFNPLFNSKKIFLGQDDFNMPDNKYSYVVASYDSLSKTKSLSEMKLELTKYLKNRQSQLPNYDLGDFGKYLGYAQTLAVVLMAIAHISKYGFK